MPGSYRLPGITTYLVAQVGLEKEYHNQTRSHQMGRVFYLEENHDAASSPTSPAYRQHREKRRRLAHSVLATA